MVYGYGENKTHPRPCKVGSESINFIPKNPSESAYTPIMDERGVPLIIRERLDVEMQDIISFRSCRVTLSACALV